MNMVDIEMASRFAKIADAVDENGIVYIPPSLHVCGKIVVTTWRAKHFGFKHTGRLNYWKATT